MRDYTPKHDKVIFIGKGHGWWEAPKDAEGYDIWGINDIVMQRNDIGLLFNMHKKEDYSPVDMASAGMASSLGIPIVMIEEYPDIPTSIAFPIKECMEMFDTDYISTAIPYMFAYAAIKGYKQIDCYGVNMRGDDEKYKNARASVEFWIGLCMGKGIKVNMRGKYCDCLKAFDRRIYGYNWLQTKPHDINDRALYVTFGASLDRQAIDKFFNICNTQPNGKYYNNLRAIPLSNDPHQTQLFENLHEMIVRQGDGKKFVGDVGFYNLLHVDMLINSEHSAKVIILEPDNLDVVRNDWLTFLKDVNPWTKQDGQHWNGYKASPYDAFFPKYDLPREKAFDRFMEEYITIGRRAQYKFPGYIRIYKASDLDNEEKVKEILKFIGYTDEEIVLPKKEATV